MNILYLRLLFSLTALMFLSKGLDAQDPYFTQYYASPSLVNPALSASSQGAFRIFNQYRSQWNSILENPITTYTVGGDVHFDMPYDKSYTPDRLSISMAFVSDRLGSFDYGTTSLIFGSAFHKSIAKNKLEYVSVGFQLGLNVRNFIYEDIVFQDQFNGVDAFSLATSELRPANNFGHGDIHAGINYSSQFKQFKLVQVGLSIQHITSSNVSFYRDFNMPGSLITTENKLFSKINFSASAEYEVNEYFIISPRILYSSQVVQNYAQAGVNLRIEVGELVGRAVQFGAAGRMVDGIDGFSLTDIIAMAGFELNGLNIGLSYDFNISSFRAIRQRPSSFEISLAFIGKYENEDNTCPKF